MPKVKIGARTMELKASPLAPYFYRVAFNSDLVADTVNLKNMAVKLAKAGKEGFEDIEGFDLVQLQQLAYAMDCAAREEQYMTFVEWLKSLEYITVDTWVARVVEIAVDGFFRTAGSDKPAKPKTAKQQPKRSSKPEARPNDPIECDADGDGS